MLVAEAAVTKAVCLGTRSEEPVDDLEGEDLRVRQPRGRALLTQVPSFESTLGEPENGDE